MENRIENLIKNELSQKNSINQLTNMLEEEQNNQQDMLIEVSLIILIMCLYKSYFIKKINLIVFYS